MSVCAAAGWTTQPATTSAIAVIHFAIVVLLVFGSMVISSCFEVVMPALRLCYERLGSRNR